MTINSSQRFTASAPCPVCGGHNQEPRGQGKRCHGFLSSDRNRAYCSREELAGPLPLAQQSETYAHRLVGDCRCGTRHDLQPPSPQPNTNVNSPRRIVDTYDYTDEEGNLLFQVVRHEPKGFAQRRPNDNGGWIWNLKCVEPVLYHLPELLAADQSQPVFITEGEKQADILWELGLVATTFPMGAGKSHLVKDLSALEGRHVVILPDNDPPGRSHGQQVADRVSEVAKSVRVLRLPDLLEKGDIIDWLAAGHAGEELMELTQKCPKWELDQEQSKAAKWETPQPFHSIEVPDFPSDVLPGVVGEYVLQEAEAKQVPVDLPACLALGAIAGVVAGKYQIKLSDDWSEPLNLFIACALPSGERKSPEFRDVLGPIETYERAKLEEAGPDILKKQTERDILEWRLKNAKGAAAKGPQGERIAAEAEARALAEELANFKMPSSPRLLADDATPEAVSGLLAEQNGRLMIASTEGGIFDIIGGRYSDGAPNLDVYLKAYSGDPIRVDRRSRPAEIIPNPALTVLLTVQPSVITDLVERRTFRGRGLLARILYSLPKSMVGYRSADALPVDAEVKMQWSDIVTTLLKLPLPNKEDIPLLTLSSEAAIEFRTFRERVEIDLRPGGELDDLADWGNKLPGNVARFAGLIHLTSWSGNLQNLEISQYTLQPNYEPIGKKTMEEAIRLGHYFEVMAKAAFALMGADAGVMEAKRVWSVIDQHNLTQFSVSKLLQKHLRRSFKNSSALKVVLDNLEELGYVRRVEEPERESRGRSPSPVYETNPRGRTLNSDNSFYSPDPANLQNLEISQYKEVDTDEDVVVRA